MDKEQQAAHEIASKAVNSSAWSIGASVITLFSGFVRSILLARLLAPEDFGLVALAMVFANMATMITTFGFNAALIQYKGNLRDATSTHFVLRISLAVGVTLLALLASPILHYFYPARAQLVPVLLLILAIRIVGAANSTPETLLQRRLEFKRLMILNVASSLSMTLVAPLLAWTGWGVWSLVIGELGISVLVNALGLWTLRRVWTVRLFLDRQIAKHYFRFGIFVMLSRQLSLWLEQFDGFWIGTTLGDTALGLYSKAFEFARYPSRVVAAPLQGVVFSTYARLQDDRRRLSKAYYSVNGLVIRVGFLLSLGLVLVAQEFVTLFLGAKWLPMVTTFQLMIVYCLFDPLIVTAGSLATAVGHPQILTRIKVLQIGVFVPLVIILAHYFGIEGVAIAADTMVFVGVVLILHQVRPFVDFSLKKLFAVPFLALLLSAVAAIGMSEMLALQGDWPILIARAATAGVVYTATLLVLERNEYKSMIEFTLKIIKNKRKV